VIQSHESVANGGTGITLISTTGYSIVDVSIIAADIEYVPLGKRGLYVEGCKNITIHNSQFSGLLSAGVDAAFAAVQFHNSWNCAVINPMWRGSSDGFVNPTHYIYLSGGSKYINLQNSKYFSTPIGFDYDTEYVNYLTCSNLDSQYIQGQCEFLNAEQLFSTVVEKSVVNYINGYAFKLTGGGTFSFAAVKIGKIKKIGIVLYNDTVNTGVCGVQARLAIPGASAIYATAGGTISANSTRTIYIDANFVITEFGSISVYRNSSGDTLSAEPYLIGVKLIYE
jgi:hypothetical protein